MTTITVPLNLESLTLPVFYSPQEAILSKQSDFEGVSENISLVKVASMLSKLPKKPYTILYEDNENKFLLNCAKKDW